jgi:hypothetical protein
LVPEVALVVEGVDDSHSYLQRNFDLVEEVVAALEDALEEAGKAFESAGLVQALFFDQLSLSLVDKGHY